MSEITTKDSKEECKAQNSSVGKAISVKVICLGDSAVGKSKLLERFLSDQFKPQQNSTYALTLYKYKTTLKEEGQKGQTTQEQEVNVEFWDTAGQERFQNLHPSYYNEADACILVFDSTRKPTYKNLGQWYEELRAYRPQIPVYCAANKIDANMTITTKIFAFAEKNNIRLFYVSAATGANVVTMFREAIKGAVGYKKNPTYWADQVYLELDKPQDKNKGDFGQDTQDEDKASDRPKASGDANVL